ncbi:T9SS sorting signal type C domain-containing protein [Flavobacterium sp.]|jgi:hypothetical protein|uniref:T9SS sorting signal type C domain-containing protein n=1 Tax=Flavobacterium sp. TaxID=239 RepID=UPI0037BEEA28
MYKPELRSIKNTALLSKPSTAIRLLLMVLFVSLFVNFANAQKTWDGGGDNVNWDSANNWNPNGIPTSTDAVILTNNDAVTVNISTAVCASLQLGGTADNTRGTIIFSASGSPMLTVGGAITMGGSNGNADRSGTITFVSGSTLICGSLTLGNSNNSPSTLTMSANSTLRTGSLSVGGTGTTWTPSTGTVVLTANNTLPTTIFTSFNSLTINSGETTFGAATTITSNFSINTGARANLGIFTHTAGTLRFAGTAQLPESFGATISPADNKNNFYFLSTIGIVNNSCISPTISQPSPLTICENSGGTFAVATSAASPTYQWQYSINAGVNWINTTGVAGFSGHTSATLTLSNIPTSYNGYRLRCIVRSSSGCRTNSNSVLLTVNATPSVPTLVTNTQPTCTTTTGSVVLNGLPASGTLSQTGTASETYAITGTTMTISGLAAGTYNFTVSNGTCTSAATANVVINPIVTNTWNGGWDNGIPNNEQALIFAAGYSSPTDVSGCSCQVNIGVNVTINAPHTLTITNAVTVLGTGTLTFDYDNTFGVNPISSASLVQINNVPNSGNIKYLRRTNTNVISTDYTYWSSPVSGQTMFNLSPNTLPSMFYSYQATATDEGWQQESSGNTMAPGLGYSIGGPKVITPPETYLATFTGVPNNGTITLSNIFENKSYLLGNPYPSAIDADKFLQDNAAVLSGTIYFWTHNTTLQDRNNIASTAGSGALAYTSDDYATYNGVGGVGAYDLGSSTSDAESSGSNTSIPSGKIAAGQGFFASTQASIADGSSIVYNNTIRLAGEIAGVKNNAQFFKTRNPASKTSNAIEKNRVWLNLTNTQGAFKQTLIGYITDATNEYDSRFDGESFDGNNFVDFYSINCEKNLTIQGRALPFDENDEVPLGYRAKINGDFTIAIAQTDGLLNNQNVFIEDKVTNKVFNLKEGNYTFNTAAGTFNNRFVLRYTNKTLGINDFDAKGNTVLISIKNQKIQINSITETIDKVTIFDLLGRQIYQKNKVNNNELLLSDFVSSHQTLIVKTTLQNGKVVTEKIVY